MPRYAGQVKCIYIDPPYNTGNEGWAYNDNVNSPVIKEWLEANPIGIEDSLRHDKWCAMMWPRLRLLHELLAENGAIFISIDDHEQGTLRLMCDEIFGADNFVANIVWQKKYSPANDAKYFSDNHDFILLYAKQKDIWRPNLLERSEESIDRYQNKDGDLRGPWKSGDLSVKSYSAIYDFPITTPSGRVVNPPQGGCWRVSKARFEQLLAENRIWFGENGSNVPSIKRFLSDVKNGVTPLTVWTYQEVGHNQAAKQELKYIFSDRSEIFDTPKPTTLLSRILQIGADSNAVILDSFAGSATTAHAVLEANKRDGGNRRFIAVEMEDYADTLTAERLRRVINGYEFQGTQKTELLRESLSYKSLTKAADLVHKVDGVENLEKHRFDKIAKRIDGGELIVTGEKIVTERTEGLGGTFTFCTLGEAVDLDRILQGDALPSFSGLGAALFHMATNRAFDPAMMQESIGYLGATEGQHVWLIYKPELDWLKSPDAALTLARAKGFAAAKPDKPHLVFAPARYVSQKMLNDQRIPVEFVPLPFALYRIERA